MNKNFVHACVVFSNIFSFSKKKKKKKQINIKTNLF